MDSGASTLDTGQVRLTLPARPEFVSVARLTMAGVASRLGYDVDGAEDIKLAVAEAMTLLLRETGEGDPVELCASWSAAGLEIELRARRGRTVDGEHESETDDEDAAIAVMVMAEVMDSAEVDGLGEGAADQVSVRLRKARSMS